jgi:hypothetical protein
MFSKVVEVTTRSSDLHTNSKELIFKVAEAKVEAGKRQRQRVG